MGKHEFVGKDELTFLRRGNAVATAVWNHVQRAKAIELVPWVSDPSSPEYDPIKTAAQNGYRKAIAEIEQIILATGERQ